MRISDWSSGVLFRSRIGEVLHRRRPCRGDIDDSRVGKRVLKSQSRSPLLRRLLVAALALSTRRIGHRMCLIENDRAAEVSPAPFCDLLDSARLALAALRSKRRLGRSEARRVALACIRTGESRGKQSYKKK